MIFCELEKEEFMEFLKNHPLNDFTQSPQMEEIGKLSHYSSYYVGVKKNEKIVAAGRIMLQKGKFGMHCYSPRGLILDYHDKELLTFFVKELKKYLKKKKGYVLTIDPKIPYKERDINGNFVQNGYDNTDIIESLKSVGFIHEGFDKGMDTSKQVRWVFILPLLEKSEEDVWKEMDANTRNLIRKAEKIGVEIRELSYDELELFKKITENTSQRRNFHDRTLAYYQKMYQLFKEKDEVHFLLATLPIKKYRQSLEEEKQKEIEKLNHLKVESKRKNSEELIHTLDKNIKEAERLEQEEGENIYLSASMFMTYGNEVIYLFCGNIDKYMKFNAQYLMQWHMIKYAIQHHFPVYNFYGISGIFDKKDKDYGIYEFKKKFNGVVVEYIGSFHLPLSPLYKMKLSLKKN